MAYLAVRDPVADIIAKAPPQNLDAEEAVLAAILMDGEALHVCLEHITADDFYKEAHRLIFRAMTELMDRGSAVDLVPVTNHLQSKAHIEQAGGAAYLSHLLDGVTVAANVETYVKVVREKSLMRALIRAAGEIVTDCYTSGDRASDMIDRAEQRMFKVSGERDQRTFMSARDLVVASYKHIEYLCENRGKLTGLSTGFTDMDELTSGLQRGDLFIVAGRPSMGKTAFALNMAVNAARADNCTVGVFSLEMGREQLMMRMLTAEARVDGQRVRKGELMEADWYKLQKAAGILSELKIFIDDQPAQSIYEIRAKCRRLHKQSPGGLGLVIVDYLQLVCGVYNTNSREQEISEISRSLKALAKELQVPVVALSQLNRMVESRDNKRPRMSDLRESGAIEQDADVVSFVYRDEFYNPDSSPDRGIAEIVVGKHRNGPIGTVKLAFIKEFTRFEDLAFDPHAPGPQNPQGGGEEGPF